MGHHGGGKKKEENFEQVSEVIDNIPSHKLVSRTKRKVYKKIP